MAYDPTAPTTGADELYDPLVELAERRQRRLRRFSGIILVFLFLIVYVVPIALCLGGPP